jgi:hypothetical protein
MTNIIPNIQYPCVKCGHEQRLHLTPTCKAAPDLLEALKWAIGVIEVCEKHSPNIDWSVGHFGRKTRAQAAIAKAMEEA